MIASFTIGLTLFSAQRILQGADLAEIERLASLPTQGASNG
jgi:hypothetical protein